MLWLKRGSFNKLGEYCLRTWQWEALFTVAFSVSKSIVMGRFMSRNIPFFIECCARNFFFIGESVSFHSIDFSTQDPSNKTIYSPFANVFQQGNSSLYTAHILPSISYSLQFSVVKILITDLSSSLLVSVRFPPPFWILSKQIVLPHQNQFGTMKSLYLWGKKSEKKFIPVWWRCRIRRLHICRGVSLLPPHTHTQRVFRIWHQTIWS